MPSLWVKGPSNTEFFVNTFPAEDPKASIIFCHGFIEHIGRYVDIFPLYAKRGISVVCFDQRGFGRTACDKEHNNGGMKYAMTSSLDQRRDLEHFYNTLEEILPNSARLPRFIMGHSMGGAIALGIVTRPKGHQSSPDPKTFEKFPLRGVIATSPLLHQTFPAPKWKTFFGGLASNIVPEIQIPTEVKAEDLSHDDAVNRAYVQDPLVIQKGTLKGVSDMLALGEEIVKSDYRHWPANLPLLLIHGTEDKVTSHTTSKQFMEKLPANLDKTLSLYEGGYHELHNEPNGGREKLVNEVADWILLKVSQLQTISTDDKARL